MTLSYFNPLVTTTADLRRMLDSQQITSVQIVEHYLEKIDRYEPFLNALASVAPRDSLRRIAESLDDERRSGRVRSPLHGIPIVLKDAFITASDLGMPTCAGAAVFAGAKASKNGAIVQRLIDAGLIILAKGNMTEFAGMKTEEMMPGWSAYGGQTISPYVGPIKKNEKILGHSAPGGSSSGPAVAVAAGFSPLAMGTETVGSIVTPSVRAALYALKPTHGLQKVAGMYRMTDFFDTPGPMGFPLSCRKCTADIASLLSVLLGRPFDNADVGNWEGLAVAALDPKAWQLDIAICDQIDDSEEQMIDEYKAAMLRMEQLGCTVRYPVGILDLSELNIDGKDAIMPIAFWEFNHVGIPTFIEGFSDAPVASLEGIIKFNEENQSLAMPEPFTKQDQLLRALNTPGTPEEITQLRRRLRETGKSVINRVLDAENVNCIAAPADSAICIFTAASGESFASCSVYAPRFSLPLGYPHVTIPLGKLNHNGRPFGICVIARENDEAVLLRFMAAYESMIAPRPVPSMVF
ncbi:amidase signature domain-containing protein [Nemania sp. FL0916]|nr:amidase signature domain-containing protein [Nemania sp. FL0916]